MSPPALSLLTVVLSLLAAFVHSSTVQLATDHSPFPRSGWSCASSHNRSSPVCEAVDRAASSIPFTFQWLLPQRNLSWLKQQLEEVSDHRHPRYQQWMTKDTVLPHIAPPASTVLPVLEWMTASGIPATSIVNRGDILLVNTTVGQAEALLSTQLHVYRHSDRNVTIVRSHSDVTIPSFLAPALHMLRKVQDWPVLPLHHAFIKTPSSSTPAPPSSTPSPSTPHSHHFHPTQTELPNYQCTALQLELFGYTPSVSPQWVAAQYNLTDRSTASQLSGQLAAVAGGYGDQVFSVPDLAQFLYDVGCHNSSGGYTVYIDNQALLLSDQTSNGASTPAGVEADLESVPTLSTPRHTTQPISDPPSLSIICIAVCSPLRCA